MCAFFLVVDWVLYFDTETRGPDCRHFLAGVLSPGMEATAGIRGCVLDSAGIVGSRTHELLGSLMHLVHSVYGNWFRAPRHWEETPNCNSELNMNKLGRTAPPILGYTWHFSSLQPERCFSWSRKDHKVYYITIIPPTHQDVTSCHVIRPAGKVVSQTMAITGVGSRLESATRWGGEHLLEQPGAPDPILRGRSCKRLQQH